MALFEITTTEIVKLAKAQLPEEIKKLKGTTKGFTFDLNIEHGIPLVPSSLPLKVDFWGCEEDQIIFELSINKEGKIIKKVAGKLMNIMADKIEEEFPEGISYGDGYLYISVNDLLIEEEIEIKIVSANLVNKLFHLEFKV